MNTFTLWENKTFIIGTPENPHIPYNEGLQITVSPKRRVASAWEDAELAGSTFMLAAKTCKIMENLQLAPWFNIQANGNWGLLPSSTPSFHVHVFGRNKTTNWGKPMVLPELPNTYQNDPMPEADRTKLADALETNL
jgi:diadenosine tetraphosphate (Ap4A) HIT family hydrolase